MSEKRKVRASILIYGEPRWIPKPGDKVLLRVADGSWQGGFSCISEPLEQRVVWVVREHEYQQAHHENRMPAGDTWPTDALRGADG